MKIKLLVGRVSAEGSYAPGDEIEVSDIEAYTLITSGQAEPKVKKHFAELEKRVEEKRAEESDKQAKIIAIQKEQELKIEANLLLVDLEKIVSTIWSIDPEYKAEFLERFHEMFVGNEPFDLNNIGTGKEDK
jgi:hypothetical protein